MNPAAFERLFDPRPALDTPAVRWLMLGLAGVLILTPLVVLLLDRVGALTPAHRRELLVRWRTWLIITPAALLPVLLGAFYTIVAVGILGLAAYREFARATGLFRERTVSAVVVLGILLLTFASLDNWYGLFTALLPLTVGLIAAVGVLQDRPSGYVQRVGLGVLGFMLTGACLAHLAFFANDLNYRAILIWLVTSVELNDVFAYISGKSFGRRKLAPHTSPNKTIGGALGALVATTALSALLARLVFDGTVLANWPHVLVMGAMISILGQMGDLLLSSIKRDIGIKDMGTLLAGHGGLLDRFDSLILVAPALFHYIGYFLGVGWDQPSRIFTGT